VSRRTPFLERRALNWYRGAGIQLLLTPSPWQARLFTGPVVVDLDDPARTSGEQSALCAANIEHVIVTTELTADYVKDANQGVQVTVLPQGVDVDRARRASHFKVRQKLLGRLGAPSETVIVGYHAPIICLSDDSEFQGPSFETFYVDVLLTAVHKLWSEGLSFVTVLLGNASPAIRHLARSEARLVLMDYVDRDRLFDSVGVFDIGTYPRIVDFQGRQSVKLLEYMACGAAIVAMFTSETRFLHENALGYTAPDSDEFCRRLRSLIIDHDARRAFGERGRRFVLRHDWDALAIGYDAILASAVELA
jgi:glycosyltransferase involved in cell wall biosynthesis